MIKSDLQTLLKLSNPWLVTPEVNIFSTKDYIPRIQTTELMNPNWDNFITILTGPRQAGKTTLGRYLSQLLIDEKRYQTLIYLNCDELLIREWLTGSYILQDLISFFRINNFILFIDEVQRLENPGLLLKSMFDLQLPIKIIASGSSQLEIKSKVQEFLTGRHLESVILPLSYEELNDRFDINMNPIYGCYPQIVLQEDKGLVLNSLYQSYVNKDIIEILKIKNVDVFQNLVKLIAHSSGQLINYQQLATDCRVSSHVVQHYLSILENTYVLHAIKPYVGNKRSEVTSNPIYYFIDNGFRNQALNNFTSLDNRTDAGLLIEAAVFQELYKLKIQHYLNLNLYYWRTKSGAEVDFIVHKNEDTFIPVEVKWRHLTSLGITRGYRSFLQAYQPKMGMVITKDIYGKEYFENCEVHFVPFTNLVEGLRVIQEFMK